jgi:hypothetical protein
VSLALRASALALSFAQGLGLDGAPDVKKCSLAGTVKVSDVLAVWSLEHFLPDERSGWSRGLEVSGGGQGVVSRAGLALLRHLADKTGLTGGLARALATARLLVHDRGRVLADLACAIADGARVISDFRVMGDQGDGGEGWPSPS